MKMAKATRQDFDVMDKFFQFLEDNESESESGMTDEDLGYQVRQWMRGHLASARNRVIIGCDILIEQVCDPDKSYLAYKPEILKYVPETENEQGETLFYVISYKHTQKGILSFWCANDAGYTRDLRYAGKYTESQVLAQMDYYHNGEHSVAVSVKEFHDGRFNICQRVDVNPDEKVKHLLRTKLGILFEKNVANAVTP